MGLVSWLNRTFRTDVSSAPPAEIADGAEDVSVGHAIATDNAAPENVFTPPPISETTVAEEAEPTGVESDPRVSGMANIMRSVIAQRIADGHFDDNLEELESRIRLVQEAPISALANKIVEQAIEACASHIHIEPGIRVVRVRYRIDGVLHEVMPMPKYIQSPLTNRYKVLAEIDRATHRGLPQEGRFAVTYDSIDYNICVNSHPTRYGDYLTLHLHSCPRIRSGYDALGISPELQEQLGWLLYRPCGMVLVVGPASSGSTTTQYSLLNHMNTVGVHIMTVEERVTYSVDGLTQVVPDANRRETQAISIRSALRQDVDVVGIGDLRDKKTVQAALEAAATSLVIATMHGNEALSTLVRLASLGIDPGLIASTIQGVITQRRVRRICPHCKELYEVAARELRYFGFDPEDPEGVVTIACGTGCGCCHHTGYLDCIGLYELFQWNDTLINMFSAREALPRLKQAFAWSHRSDAIRDDGLKKILAHVTTPEEVCRVL